MPYIKVSASTPIEKEQEQVLKSGLGAAIALIPGKSERWLMIELAANRPIYLHGNQDGPAAMVKIETLGLVSATDCLPVTEEVCRLVSQVLSIPGERIFVNYQAYAIWGCDGKHF